MTNDFVLLIRAVDAGATYLSYRWLDDPGKPQVEMITEKTMHRLRGRLAMALIGTESTDGSDDASVRRTLSGPFTRYLSELAISEALTRSILPARVVAAISDRASRGSVTVRVTPSRSLAQVPFELLVVDGDRRLIECANVCYEPPATIHVGRGRIPEPWTPEVAARPVLSVIDPLLPPGSGLGQILSAAGVSGGPESSNAALLGERIVARAGTPSSGVQQPVGRGELSDDLHLLPGRMVYFGHASSTLDAPGSASIHLDDDAEEWGLAELVNGVHRPLSALDLLFGTSLPEIGPSEIDPVETGMLGHVLWPMPPRVAVIACEGGVDYRSTETFGLVMAILSSGAEILTTTRWVVPSDRAFEEYGQVTSIPGPATELALAVDDTHTEPDPVIALARWQRNKLEQWREQPGPLTSPLTWASVGVHVCPPRAVVAPERPEQREVGS